RALRARPAPGTEGAPARAQDSRRRGADRLGCEDHPGGWLRLAPTTAARPGSADLWRRGGTRERAGAEGDPLRDRVGQTRRRGGLRNAPARRDAVAARGPRALRQGAARELRLARPAAGAEHAPGLWARLLARRSPGRRDDR